MNRLATETSPYLRQHAGNPVEWYPWGHEAFDRARAEDKPVLLSIGYSSCHWCHVMAHESFEDTATARDINAGFVPVKVDREERPDVDALYMDALQALTGRGGWPMTVFLTPDARPFYAGTYFPPVDGRGMPAFRRVLEAVLEAWRERRPDLDEQADSLTELVGRRMRAPFGDDAADTGDGRGDAAARRVRTEAGPGGSLPHDVASLSPAPVELVTRAVGELASRFDAAWGGFGPAPKFPQPQLIELCLRHHRLHGDDDSLAMVLTTLGAMAAGGIYDHVGGGFARYATDTTWTVPHFEKMLYDQASLARVFLHAWLVTGAADLRQVVEETVGYVLGTLGTGEGGWCSAEDADSEGEEGRFYLWTEAQLEEVLGPELAAPATAWYGVLPDGNFEGRSILRRPPGAPLRRPPEVEEARRRMAAARASRVRPGLDDKVLTEWNAMFGATLAEAAAATGRRDWADAAVGAAEFLLASLCRPDGRWLRSWQGGRAHHLAYCGDYAWLVDFFTRLAELTGHALWLEHATDTARAMVALFAGDGPLLYTTGHDAETLVVRPLDVLDGAVPAANSVAAGALLRLGALLGDDSLVGAGAALLEGLWTVASRQPLAAAHALAVAASAEGAAVEVVVTGDRPDLLGVVRARYEPTAVLAWGDPTPTPLWEGRAPGLAYVCRGYACRTPASSPAELAQRLDEARAEEAAAAGAPVPSS